jgi:hypothetical protein
MSKRATAANAALPKISAAPTVAPMSIQQLKSEAGALSAEERRELIGYLVALGRERSASYWDALSAKIENRDPSHWVREEDLDRVLNLDRPGE